MATTTDFAAARREMLTSFPQYFSMLQGLAAPYQADFSRAGVTGGMGLAQDYRSALGRLGGAGTGMGAVGSSISTTLASTLSAQMRQKFFEMLFQGAQGMQGQALAAGGPGAKTATNPYLASMLGSIGGIGAMFIPGPKGSMVNPGK